MQVKQMILDSATNNPENSEKLKSVLKRSRPAEEKKDSDYAAKICVITKDNCSLIEIKPGSKNDNKEFKKQKEIEIARKQYAYALQSGDKSEIAKAEIRLAELERHEIPNNPKAIEAAKRVENARYNCIRPPPHIVLNL